MITLSAPFTWRLAPLSTASSPSPTIVVWEPTVSSIRSACLAADARRASSWGPLGLADPQVRGS